DGGLLLRVGRRLRRVPDRQRDLPAGGPGQGHRGVFFAIAQCFGSLGSHLYGRLIGTGKDPNSLYWGYLLGAGAMILGGVVAAFLAVDAEGKSLEDVAKPLGVIGGAFEGTFRSGDPRQGGLTAGD